MSVRRPPGPSLTDVANGLRTTFPHPRNAGPRRIPSPAAVEGWLVEQVRLGKLLPDQYAEVLAAAGRETEIAEQNPEKFRRQLRTWIRESGWGDEVQDSDPVPVMPPKDTGPKYTPEGWATGQDKA